MHTRRYQITKEEGTMFHTPCTFCIGTGRMYLALRQDYRDHLEMLQKDIGFSYIRGYGIFTDDMGIYQEYEEDGKVKVEYNFTYTDKVFDYYLSVGIKPFVEFGFMPKALGSGDKTHFYWKGNMTPPKDYGMWADLVKSTVWHWIGRYGRDEVITWFFEVWNEPNLEIFWEDANMEEYFKLYQVTSDTVKSIDKGLRIGGPAICGGDDRRWVREFLAFCQKNEVAVDFITRHFYTVGIPKTEGRYDYQELREHDSVFAELKGTREEIEKYERYKGMDIHITEFNTAYSCKNPLHDTNLNAAYLAKLLGSMGEICASYAYWTFSDVFEEEGIPFTPFHGGFGLIAEGKIPKPTYWVFALFKELGNRLLLRDENGVVTKDGERISGVIWNPVFHQNGAEKLEVSIRVPCKNGEYGIVSKSVSETNCNPQLTWYNIGSPSNPTKKQLELIRQTAYPEIRTERIMVEQDEVTIPFTLTKNEVLYFELNKMERDHDRGFKLI